LIRLETLTAVWLCSAKSQTSLFCIQNLVLIGPKNAYVQLAAYADYKSAISIVRDALRNIRDSGICFQNLVLKGLINVCTQLAVGVDYKSTISIVRDAPRNIRDSGIAEWFYHQILKTPRQPFLNQTNTLKFQLEPK
jgi:hypothetical protein